MILANKRASEVKGVVILRSEGYIANILLHANPVIHLHRNYEYAGFQKVLEGLYEGFRY